MRKPPMKTHHGGMADSADQESMVIPLDVGVEDGDKVIRRIDWLEEAGDELAHHRVDLRDPRGWNGHAVAVIVAGHDMGAELVIT